MRFKGLLRELRAAPASAILLLGRRELDLTLLSVHCSGPAARKGLCSCFDVHRLSGEGTVGRAQTLAVSYGEGWRWGLLAGTWHDSPVAFSALTSIATTPETFPIPPPTWFQHLDHGTFIGLSNSQDIPLFSLLETVMWGAAPHLGFCSIQAPSASICMGQRMEIGPTGCAGSWEPAKASQWDE